MVVDMFRKIMDDFCYMLRFVERNGFLLLGDYRKDSEEGFLGKV